MELTILTKMTDKETAIVDNLNNERVATIYKKEQTLSDKEQGPFDIETYEGNKTTFSFYAKENVKEFIKKLKGFVNRLIIPSDILVKLDIQDEIDKLAGPKLVEQTQTQEVGK